MSDWRTLLDREIRDGWELPKMEKVSFQRPSLRHLPLVYLSNSSICQSYAQSYGQ